MDNLYFDVPAKPLAEELFSTLLTRPGLRIERIISTGQPSPQDYWYDQEELEWVILLAGEAKLRFADEMEVRHLRPGDWISISPHRRHRVEWTSSEPAAIWLAVHHQEPEASLASKPACP